MRVKSVVRVAAMSACGGGGKGSPSTVVTMLLPVTPTAYWRLENGAWFQFTGATVSGNRVTFELTDNGTGDTNPDDNRITDPGSPAAASTPTIVGTQLTGLTG